MHVCICIYMPRLAESCRYFFNKLIYNSSSFFYIVKNYLPSKDLSRIFHIKKLNSVLRAKGSAHSYSSEIIMLKSRLLYPSELSDE